MNRLKKDRIASNLLQDFIVHMMLNLLEYTRNYDQLC